MRFLSQNFDQHFFSRSRKFVLFYFAKCIQLGSRDCSRPDKKIENANFVSRKDDYNQCSLASTEWFAWFVRFVLFVWWFRFIWLVWYVRCRWQERFIHSLSLNQRFWIISFQPHKSQQHTFFHSVTRIYSKTESDDQMLSSEENQKVLINELDDFYQFWSCISLILIAFVLLAIILVRIKRINKRRRPTSANIDLNFTKPYSYEPLPYKSII